MLGCEKLDKSVICSWRQRLRKFRLNYGLVFFLSVPLIVIDLISKSLVRANLQVHEAFTPVEWLPFFRLLHVQNTGVAFGMLQGAGWVFAILAVIISCGILFYFPRVDRRDGFVRVALALQLAGAVGNLIDRIFFGPVTDFVSIGNFAIFNVADASISIGTVLLVIGFAIQETRDKKSKKEMSSQ